MMITLKKCYLTKLSTVRQPWYLIANISVECGADFVKNLLPLKYLVNKVLIFYGF